MAGILRVKARWSGFIGGPGYSVFHFKEFENSGVPAQADADGAAAKVRQFFFAIRFLVPANTVIQVMSDVEVIEETDNKMVNVLTAAAQSPVMGGAGATVPYSAPTGAVVTWRTNLVRNSRRVRGRTFLVPLSSAAFAPDGTLMDTSVTQISDAALALRSGVGSGDLGVYARPTTKGATDGFWAVVSGHSVPDMGAMLTSRR